MNGASSPCTSVSIRPTNWHFGTETSSRHNHSCITLFVDLEVLFATPGKDAATFKPFTKGPNAHGGAIQIITDISMDQSPTSHKGAIEYLPNANRDHLRPFSPHEAD